MELYIDENGKARDIDECSVNIVCESKEEADKMMEGLVDGRLVMVEWHPIEVVNGKVLGELPKCRLSGKSVLISYRTDSGEVWAWSGSVVEDEDGHPFFFLDGDKYWTKGAPDVTKQDAIDPDRVLAWADLPKPYKGES